MPAKSGLDTSIGIGIESTYAEFATPTVFFPGTETIDEDSTYDKGEDLQQGLYGHSLGLMTQTSRAAAGNLMIKPASKGFGKILNLFHGNTVTSTGAGTAKTWVHNYGRSVPDGKSVSVQSRLPDVEGDEFVKTSLGMVGTSIEFVAEVGKALACTVGLAGQQVVDDEAEASVTYPTTFETFSSKRTTFKIDDAIPAGKVSKVSLKYDTPRKTDRQGLDGTDLNGEPISNAKQACAGTVTLELAKTDALFTAYKDASPHELELQCLGALDIETGIKPSLTLLVPNAVFEKYVPKGESADVITIDVPFTGYLDGTDPSWRATLVTTDTTT